MKITFVDLFGWDYTTEAPLTRPTGGSQSALCYLAAELARNGHGVSLVNDISQPGDYLGVHCVHQATSLNAAFLNQADVVVVLASTDGADLRDRVGVRKPLVMWSHHASDQPAVRALQRIRERKAWSGFAFTSAWHRRGFIKNLWVPPEKCVVLGNCAAPAFIEAPVAEPWFVRGEPPVLAYTSTPFRGLDVLLRAFPAIREGVPEVRLRVYSSMEIYNVKPEDDRYVPLYDVCRRTEGVDYIGPVGQPQLAKELSGMAALAYPNTFAETFCIAALEALCTGAMLLTTRLGALPELYGEYAGMVDLPKDKEQLARDFAELVIASLRQAQADPAAANARRAAQIATYRERFSWTRRAREWEEWLSTLA
jgi:glycosyltransferase involved in cell wall biosynthesis